jgi:phage-related protein (TIGR01555 family)
MFKLIKRFMPDESAKNADKPTPPKSQRDPLDISPHWDNTETVSPIQKTIKDFPLHNGELKFAMDAAIKGQAMDDAGDTGGPNASSPLGVNGMVPNGLQNWYGSQGFPGYQTLGIMAQHWLVDKACSMAGDDAVRNGWTIRGDSGDEITGQLYNQIHELDIKFKVKQNLAELNRFNNIFGIRVAFFEVDSDDADYYAKPFNIDGITANSYKGISQVDPYWMTPMLTTESTADPSNIHFYDPEFWIISGKKYHRSHLIIARGPQPADILKPTYIFGGVSLVQRIYERVYAAERTANEAPLLAMNKRTTAIHVDMEKAVMNEQKFTEKLMFWIRFRDNHAVKVLGAEETMEQFDTSLADFDSVIMSQYQLVAAIAETPATKLLGTPPKGFNATGEFETVSYHEKLESIQENVMQPLLDRHYEIAGRSLQLDINIHAVWEPVDSVTTSQQAEINDKKADTAIKYITGGVVAPDEVRNALRQDRHAGFTTLTHETANETPGLSPENLAAYAEASAENTKAAAAVIKSGAQEQSVQAGGGTNLENAGKGGAVGHESTPAPGGAQESAGVDTDPAANGVGTAQRINPNYMDYLAQITKLMAKLPEDLRDHIRPEGVDVGNYQTNRDRTTGPSTDRSIMPSVGGISDVAPSMDPLKLPKMKLNGMTIAVENPRGSIRRGQDVNGKQWQAKMAHHYGFIKGVRGADGDELDAFVGPNFKAPMAHVINQNDPNTGEFDEHKVMLGFDSPEAARKGYDDSFNAEWKGFDSMVSLPMDQFKQWISSGNCQNPLSEAQIGQAGSAPETE